MHGKSSLKFNPSQPYHVPTVHSPCRIPSKRSTIPETLRRGGAFRKVGKFMNRLPFPSSVRLTIALLAISLAASAVSAQAPAPGQTPPAATGQPAQPAPPATKPNPENDWLARTSKLYYSSARAGLTGFDCEVHPDWHTLFVSANKSTAVEDADARIRSEEHTSELQSRQYLVCRLLLEKKK